MPPYVSNLGQTDNTRLQRWNMLAKAVNFVQELRWIL